MSELVLIGLRRNVVVEANGGACAEHGCAGLVDAGQVLGQVGVTRHSEADSLLSSHVGALRGLIWRADVAARLVQFGVVGNVRRTGL